MDGKSLFRIAAAALVGVAATVAAIEINGRDRTSQTPSMTSGPASVEAEPLHALLIRCQRLGAAATRDPICLKTWADNRRRFLRANRPSSVQQSQIARSAPELPSPSVPDLSSPPSPSSPPVSPSRSSSPSGQGR